MDPILSTVFWAQDISYFDPNSNKEAVEIKNNYSIYYNNLSFINQI